VAFSAKFVGHHSLNGGPVKPSEPPKKTECDYTYIIDFDQHKKIKHMHKVWDQLTAFLKWGWPLPPNTLYKDPKVGNR